MDTPEQRDGLANPTTGHYDVLALRYATVRAPKREFFYRYETYGEHDGEIEVEMAYYFWVLRSATETILIDTGFDPAVGVRRGRTLICPPLEALRRAGVDPQSVSTVLITHLHYDHIGNLGAFPGARLIVPRRDLEFWTGPLAGRAQFAAHVETGEIAAIAAAHRAGRVTLTDGVEQVADGVTATCVGGHSPGQLVVVVRTRSGDVVLTSDAVHFYEEFELDRPFGVTADIGSMYEAYDLIRKLGSAEGAVIVPAHDPAVLARFQSPAPALSEIAVRLGPAEQEESRGDIEPR